MESGRAGNLNPLSPRAGPLPVGHPAWVQPGLSLLTLGKELQLLDRRVLEAEVCWVTIYRGAVVRGWGE